MLLVFVPFVIRSINQRDWVTAIVIGLLIGVAMYTAPNKDVFRWIGWFRRIRSDSRAPRP
jgi:hypothetical protein